MIAYPTTAIRIDQIERKYQEFQIINCALHCGHFVVGSLDQIGQRVDLRSIVLYWEVRYEHWIIRVNEYEGCKTPRGCQNSQWFVTVAVISAFKQVKWKSSNDHSDYIASRHGLSPRWQYLELWWYRKSTWTCRLSCSFHMFWNCNIWREIWWSATML